jgi:hypothetical protein
MFYFFLLEKIKLISKKKLELVCMFTSNNFIVTKNKEKYSLTILFSVY